MDFNSKQRRKSIKVWLSDEERILVESKAESDRIREQVQNII